MFFFLYTLSLSSFTLGFGLSEGTELLGLAFFQLFIAFLINQKISGYFLAFAFLTRYNFVLFFPFLFINKDWKKIFLNIFTFILVVMPWFIFNYLYYSSLFSSIIDSYNLNMHSRIELTQPFDFVSLLSVIGLSLPFFVWGIIISIKKILKKKKFSSIRFELLFVIIFILILWEIIKIPYKVKRYMFNLTISVAFFSALGAVNLYSNYSNKYLRKFIVLIILIIFLIGSYQVVQETKHNINYAFYHAALDIKKLGIEKCEIVSPHWVLVSYYTENVFGLSDPLDDLIEDDKIILLFSWTTFDDTFNKEDIDKLNILYKSNTYTFYAKKGINGANCKNKYVFNRSFVKDPVV